MRPSAVANDEGSYQDDDAESCLAAREDTRTLLIAPAATSPCDVYHQRRLQVKQLLEDPESSKLASAVSVALIASILVSTVIAVVETMPEVAPYVGIMAIPEAMFTFIFTAEILARMWVAESCCAYWKNMSNIVDILVTLPWYVEEILHDVPMLKTFRSFRLFRMVRLLRVMRVAKSFHRSKVILHVFEALADAKTGFFVLAAMISFLSVVCATLIYMAESSVPGTAFVSIPMGIWWALTTISTVGYGDMYPVTGLGRLIGAGTMISGVLAMAVSTAIITTSFTESYSKKDAEDEGAAAKSPRRRARQGEEGSEDGSSCSESSDGEYEVMQHLADIRQETSRMLSHLEHLVASQGQQIGRQAGAQAEAAVYARVMLRSLREGSATFFSSASSLAEQVTSPQAGKAAP